MSHPVPWMDYSEECMDVSDIKKLPTRETDAVRNEYRAGPLLEGAWRITRFCESLEQQRDALMMALDRFRDAQIDVSGSSIILGYPISRQVLEDIWETLASIRQMKDGK